MNNDGIEGDGEIRRQSSGVRGVKMERRKNPLSLNAADSNKRTAP